MKYGLQPSARFDPSARLLDAGSQKQALKVLAELTQRATINPLVRTTAIKIVRSCGSRKDMCELQAIFDAVKYGDPGVAPLENGFKYIADPRFADYFASPVDNITNCLNGSCGGDCLPAETLLLTAGYKFTAIADVEIGDTVMGDGEWTRVTQKWDKGEQDIVEFKLNNGCTLRCTPEHKLFVVPKMHGCAGNRNEAYEVRARDVKLDDDLLVPERITEGRENLVAEEAWLLGNFIADGWVDYSRADGRPLRVGLSGLDGWRKEENKSRAEAFCATRGLDCRWHEEYLAVNDEGLASKFAACGRLAPNKHVPSLNLTVETVRNVLEGLSADADVRNGVFSTTSHELALQLRVMLRMCGQSAHIARIDEHGGLGKHPIYRITPRAAGDNRRKFARVKSISSGRHTHTYDIEVEGHRFYLPETDLVVHNCDDHTALIAALAGSLGWRVGLRAYGRDSSGFSHVYAVVAYPKRPPFKEIIAMDTTVPSSKVGWEPPPGECLTAWLE